MTPPDASYPTWFQRDLPMGVNQEAASASKAGKSKMRLSKASSKKKKKISRKNLY